MAYEFDEETYERLARKRRYASYLRKQRTAQREVEQSGVQDDPTFWQKALNVAGEVTKAPVVKTVLDVLSSPQRQAAGYGALAAEGLSKILPGENKYAESGVDVGVLDLIKAPMDFTGEGAVAQRGKEFNEKAARSLNVAGLGTTGPAQKAVADASPLASLVEGFAGDMDPRAGEFGGGGGLDDFTAQMGFEIATDPLNVVDAGAGLTKPIGASYRALKNTSVGRQAIIKFPSLLLPEKAWLRLSGFAKKSSVLGKSEKLNDLYIAQQAFEKNAGYEVEKFKQGVTANYVKYLNQLKGLPETEAQRVAEAVPLVVEHTDHATRMSLAESAKKRGDDASRLLYEMADDYALDADAIKALETGALKLQTKDLADEINYFGRRFTPEVEDLIARHPEAREIIFAAKMNAGADAFQQGWLSWEKGRKLRGFDFAEAETAVRQSLRKAGVPVPDKMPIFSRDAFGDLTRRADKSLEASKVRHLYQSFADTFGQKAASSDAAWQMVSEAIAKTADDAWRRAAEAEAALGVAKAGQEGFREGRAALRSIGPRNVSIPKKITDALSLVDPATTPEAARLARTLNPNDPKQVAGFRRVLGEELGQAPGVAQRQADTFGRAGARMEEVRVVTGEAQASSRISYQSGRDAQHKAVQVAEGLRDEGAALVAATPGAAEARKALSMARKALTGAKKQADLDDAARAIALAIGAKTPKGGADDVVAAAEELVRFTQQHIRNNPAIKDADAALRAANKMLADARQVAARVETAELSNHIDDLLLSAMKAVDSKGTGAKYITHAMKNELEKARKVVKEVEGYYKAVDEAKLTGQRAPKAPDNSSVRDVRAALSKMRSELRKDAPAALVREFDRAYTQAAKIAQRVEDAQGAVAKPVALAVNQRVRDAEKALTDANKLAANADVNKWSPEAQARYVQNTLERIGVKPLDGSSALDILIKAKAPLPNTPEEIARLAMTYVSPKDAREFARFAKAHYWKNIDTPGKFWRTMDAVKGIYQRAVLARPGSLAKDFQGTMLNGAMSGNTPYLGAALRELGTMGEWKQGGKISDIVARLRGEGVLKNITTEIDETQGTFKRVALQLREEGATKRAKLLETLSPIEERGVLGGITGKKVGGKIGKATDAIVEARSYTEELNRLASYMKAVKDGATHEEAVEEVLKLWGNFSELTRLDRNVLSRALFFWNWWARSIPITVRHLLDRPVKSRLLLTMMAGNASDDPSMPPWLQRMGGVIMGKDDAGNATVLSTGSGSYFSPTMSVLQGEMAKNLAQGNVFEATRGAAFDLARSAPPYISEPAGAIFSRDMFTGKRWWEDETNKVGSQIRAPMAFRFLMDTPIGDLMNLKPYEPEGDLKYITMDPKWATMMGMTPGMEPVLTDVSAFVDPRSKDVGDLSLKKGLVRQAGVPLYSVPVDNEALRNAKEGQRALRQAIDQNAHALGMSGDYVYADTDNARGKKLKTAWEMYEARARSFGFKKGSPQFKRYVASQLKRDWPAEYEYIDIGEKLRFLRQLNERGEVNPMDGLNFKP